MVVTRQHQTKKSSSNKNNHHTDNDNDDITSTRTSSTRQDILKTMEQILILRQRHYRSRIRYYRVKALKILLHETTKNTKQYEIIRNKLLDAIEVVLKDIEKHTTNNNHKTSYRNYEYYFFKK
jgi:hypothetical protein